MVVGYLVRSKVVSGEVWGGMGKEKLLGGILGVLSWVGNGVVRGRCMLEVYRCP